VVGDGQALQALPGQYAEHIDVNTASVIVRELGIAPREVPAL
jgi:hypothetical protein